MDKMLTTDLSSFSKKRQLFIGCLILFLMLNAFLPSIERTFLLGELFVFLLFPFILSIQFSNEPHQKAILLLVFVWATLFPIYGFIISQISWAADFKLIFYARHLVFFYYCVFFFAAFKYASTIVALLKKYVFLLILLFYPLSIMIGGGGTVGPSVMALILMGLSLNSKKIFFYGFFCTLLLLGANSGSGTNKSILAFYLFFIFSSIFARFWSTWFPKWFTRCMIVSITFTVIYFAQRYISYFYQLTSQMALLGDSIAALGTMSEDLHTDLSGFWRLVLWSHLYGRFLDHPWGVGLGTPLFEDWLDGFVILHLYRPGENYVQGAHNSFVTFIARMGIPALLLLGLLILLLVRLMMKILQKFNYRPFVTKKIRLLSSAFLAVGSMTVSASFNVALESPLYAGMFWFCLGLFTRLGGDFLSSHEEDIIT